MVIWNNSLRSNWLALSCMALGACNLETKGQPPMGIGTGGMDDAGASTLPEPAADAAGADGHSSQTPDRGRDSGSSSEQPPGAAEPGTGVPDAAVSALVDAGSNPGTADAAPSASPEPGLEAGAASAEVSPQPPICAQGASVVLSDYLATQIALLGRDGTVLAEHFVSTASATTQGLAFALSGDVAVPSAPTASGQVVLLDRFGTNVISWFDPATAENLAQLSVGTGFESNPMDYLEVSDDLALVSRWGQNELPGAEMFDVGGDVLVIDLDGDQPQIVDSIIMPVDGGFPARPASLVRHVDDVIVTLERVALDYSGDGEAMWAGISLEDRTLAWQHTFAGLKGCGRPELSPDANVFAMACRGQIDFDGVPEDLDQSAIVLLDAHARPPREIGRFRAADLAGESLQNDVEFVTSKVLLFKTHTAFGGDTNNRWLSLDLETEAVTPLLEAAPGSDGTGQGSVYSGMVCFPGCSDVCLLGDADQSVVQRIRLLDDGDLELLPPLAVEDAVGLPPRSLGPR
jgi:hypothetical protein